MRKKAYQIAGETVSFSQPIPELELFASTAGISYAEVPAVAVSLGNFTLISRAQGWVAGAQRMVEVHGDPSRGFWMRIEDCGEYFISPNGASIGKYDPRNPIPQSAPLLPVDRDAILGPVLVLALALHNVWSLHASAAIYKDHLFAFLGESGRGKSTLAAYLSQSPGWQLVADDILPVRLSASGVVALPRFPQLKLPLNAQPCMRLPETLPLKFVCVLTAAPANQSPGLQALPVMQAAQCLLRHIAGTRLFDKTLLSKHLDFSTRAGGQVSACKLTHPHRRDALPVVRELLENLCPSATL
ncbi:MAG: hypothetical protein HYZ23_10790 [Chloroflexi bacterium]|nr:hypothetical protein [Chloroflexota bacterium]